MANQSKIDLFATVDEIVEVNNIFLEIVTTADLQFVDRDARDYLLANLKKTIGILSLIIKKWYV